VKLSKAVIRGDAFAAGAGAWDADGEPNFDGVVGWLGSCFDLADNHTSTLS